MFTTVLVNLEEHSETGFVQVLESPGISGNHFPGLESPGTLMQVLESPGNLNWATILFK